MSYFLVTATNYRQSIMSDGKGVTVAHYRQSIISDGKWVTVAHYKQSIMSDRKKGVSSQASYISLV